MSETTSDVPDPETAGAEYGFHPDASPLEASEEKAEASGYGIYGYQGHSGEAFEGEEGEPFSPAPHPPTPREPGVVSEE